MSLLRLQDNVPEVYINNSRDFQLISRIYDCVNNGVKYDIDSIKYLSDTKNCNSSYLELLKYRQGFINSSEIDSDTLRYILQGFPYIIKNKGNVSGIQEVLNVFSKILHINLSISVEVKNFPEYLIRVIISGNPNLAPLLYRMRVIQDLIKYIAPAGYQVEFVFDIGTPVSSNININERVVLTQANSIENSLVVSVSGRRSILTDFAVEAGGTLTFQNSARLAVPSYVEYIIRPSVESTSPVTDATAAYAKTVPTGAKACTVKSIGGKSVVWNQFTDKSKFGATQTVNGITFTNNGDGSIAINGTATERATFSICVGWVIEDVPVISGHKYLINSCEGLHRNIGFKDDAENYAINVLLNVTKILTASCDASNHYDRLIVNSSTTVNTVFTPFIIDLTAIFGYGNEPTSVDDPRITWINTYAEEHPEYNAGAIISADVESVLYNDAVVSDIPTDVRSLPGYGWSAGTAHNSIERTDEGRWVYVQRVGNVDLGALEWYYADSAYENLKRFQTYGLQGKIKAPIADTYSVNALTSMYSAGQWAYLGSTYDKFICCNPDGRMAIRDTEMGRLNDFINKVSGVMLYYELAEPVTTDITDLMANIEKNNSSVRAVDTSTVYKDFEEGE